MKKGTLIAIVLVLVAAVVAVGAVISRNAKSPYEVYLKAEKSSVENMAKLIEDAYKAEYDRKDLGSRDIYRTRYELKAAIQAGTFDTLGIQDSTSDTLGISGADVVEDLLDKLKLRLDSTVNYAKGESVTDLTLYMNESPVLLGQLFSNGSELYLGADTLFPDTWFKLPVNGTGAVGTKLSKPADFNAKIDLAFDEVYKAIAAAITEDNVTSGINGGSEDSAKTVVIGGEEIDVTSISVKLDPASTKKLAEDIAKRLDEADILNAFELQLVQYIQMLVPEQTAEDMSIERMLDEMMKGREFTEGLSMDLLIDKQGNILCRDAGFSILDIDDQVLRFEVSMLATDKGGYLVTKGQTDISMYYEEAGVDYTDNIYIIADLDLNSEIVKGNLEVKYEPVGGSRPGKFKAVLEVGPEGGSISFYLDSAGTAGVPSLALNFSSERLPEIEYESPVIEGKKLYDLENMTEEEKEELNNQLSVAIAIFMLQSGQLF
ncbi:MAG: hypothetical protein PHV32_02710 [Eubacteriales bacterium]|nr:hypothetical protein [Eubacteriales bacterium]